MSRRNYANFAPTQNLTSGITNASPSLNCASFSGWPTSFPFTATLDYGLGSAEIVLVTNISGTLATITRGYDNSIAVAHAAGATFDLTPTAKDLDEANSHVNATAGVHGVSGSLVGTNDVQTLTNKTFAGSTSVGTIAGISSTWTGAVNAASVSAGGGTVTGGAATFTGALSANGATITGNQVVQGNQTVNGALSVAGNQNNSGSIAAAGAVSGSSVSGILSAKQFATQAAANTAAANVAGNIVYLTAPTGSGVVPGLYAYNVTVPGWVPLNTYDTGWTAATLVNSWVSFDGGAVFDVPSYRRVGQLVVLKGMGKSGTPPSTMFTLPAGMRPSAQQTFVVFSGTGTARVDIAAVGTVNVTALQSGGANTAVSLSGISFLAEQ